MNDLYTFQLADTITYDRLAEAANARQWAAYAGYSNPMARFRMALSARLITWGQQLQMPNAQLKTR